MSDISLSFGSRNNINIILKSGNSRIGNELSELVTTTVPFIDTLPPVITISGDISLNHEVLTAYVDDGATAYDAYYGDVSVNVVNDVCSNVIGSYTVTYTAHDPCGNQAIPKVRTVYVIDTMSPVITISGPNPYDLSVGDTYVEYNATAYDAYFGDVSVNIVSDVSMSVDGSYQVIYSASDSCGNDASAVRYVNVGPILSLPNSILFENFDGSYNLGLTSSNNYTINSGQFSTNYGTYYIKKYHNDNANDNVEFDEEDNGNNSGSQIPYTAYSSNIISYSNTNDISLGCLKMSTESYSQTNHGNWYILYPVKTISNVNDISTVTFNNSIAFNNIGSGSSEKFYYEISNNSSWQTIETMDPPTDNSNIMYNITSYVVGNGGTLELRARVEGFQNKDYLNIGSYMIETTYA